VALGLRLFGEDQLRGFGTAYALAGHFADDLGGGEDFFLWFARHDGWLRDLNLLLRIHS